MNVDEIVSHYDTHGYAVVPGLLAGPVLDELLELTARIEARAADSIADDAWFDFDQDANGKRTIQRIKKPNRIDPFYARLAGHPKIVDVLNRLLGPNIRLNHTKMNMKAANGGAALEWHQDWAFAPHTNMSTCVASIMLDGASAENGAMQVIPGSHKGPLLDHHDEEGYFAGAVDVSQVALDKAALLAGPPGTVSFHHPMTLHGSSVNRSGRSRRILFYEYAATDAFPLFYKLDWEEYDSRIVAGPPTSEVRFEQNHVKLPFPSRAGSSIYKIQAESNRRYFAEAM
ncbi:MULTISPECIES: phytanoyl-CoA dioxygenase family protein [Nitrospirillum]|uniref:Ectoine hydroxylase-related dioxygenase (Phytanoyl-CoA dioxygenase family) n=1 Tax=Nitrospirillum amazonense TaxID=28077 RepID=A0A560F220_9PROT|nr:phytanoyl-CoA dioxygenase family protein [Nitrospirillum amazonense]MEC4594722.1 phytanoyl-CoA dioxygenase family protein [Nitrospirillum amazonense]TWB15555.1 ectoine hydroxylase-related dioxygenase (phytanoyl-CoA dioxygenase family) [Nitrospirillum amazonense]